jgi:hypothetical protein
MVVIIYCFGLNNLVSLQPRKEDMWGLLFEVFGSEKVVEGLKFFE